MNEMSMNEMSALMKISVPGLRSFMRRFLALLACSQFLVAAGKLAVDRPVEEAPRAPPTIATQHDLNKQTATSLSVLLARLSDLFTPKFFVGTAAPADTARSTTKTIPTASQCTAADLDIWNSGSGKADFKTYMTTCGKQCWGAKDCVAHCVEETEKYSDSCSECFGDLGECTREHCMMPCMNGQTPVL